MTARYDPCRVHLPELLNMLVSAPSWRSSSMACAMGAGARRPIRPIAPMRSALLELRDAEGRYHAQTLHFTTRLDSLNLSPAAGITRQVDRADSISWHGTARKEGSALACGLTVGTPGVVDSVICQRGAP